MQWLPPSSSKGPLANGLLDELVYLLALRVGKHLFFLCCDKELGEWELGEVAEEVQVF